MGLIRKTASVCTFGLVKFTSRREAQTKAALAEARLARAKARSIERHPSNGNYTAYDELAARRANARDLPWYRQPTVGDALLKLREGQTGQGQ